MNRYRYEAVLPSGVDERGVVSAATPSAALAALRARRLLVVEIRETGTARRTQAPPAGRLAILFRGLAALLAGGVPLDAALGASRADSPDAPFIEGLRRRLREGAGLADALAACQGVPPVVVGLVRAGERTGLADAVRTAADQLDRDVALRGQVRGALAYPLLLLAVGTGTATVLVGSVIPRFADLLGSLGQEVPATTRTLVATGTLVADHWLLLGTILATSVALVTRWLTTEAGHAFLLRLPLVGPVRLALASSRAGHTLGAQLKAGAPALVALESAAQAAADRALSARLRAARTRVQHGAGLARALADSHALDARTLDLGALGEASGRLPDLLLQAAAMAETSGVDRLRTMLRLLEPALILLMAGGVAFVALALLQAVYGIRVR